MVRLWLVVAVLSVISWLVLKVIRKPYHFAWVLLFWTVAIFGSAGLLYGLSVLVAGL